jgi:hypothetical protein
MKQGLLFSLILLLGAARLTAQSADLKTSGTNATAASQAPLTGMLAPAAQLSPTNQVKKTNYELVVSGPVADSLHSKSAWETPKRVLNLFNPLAKSANTNAARTNQVRAASWPPTSDSSAFPDAVNHEAGSGLIQVTPVTKPDPK